MQNYLNKIREVIGVITKDYLPYRFYLYGKENTYLKLTNRIEKIASGPNNLGYVCLWPHTSRLHAPLVFPSLGIRLLKKCLLNSRFKVSEDRQLASRVRLSVLIGHRGMERLPLLLTTIKSIASQVEVELECIVIEQDNLPRIREYLPSWVRYIFLETANASDVYNRSAGFNVGASHADGDILLLHDNDMLIPNTYCRDIVHLVDKGYEALNTKRYVFYLNQDHSEKVLDSIQEIASSPPDYIVQNLEGGGSMGITKEAYLRIGGMDEEFIGWGGEDIEFWNRCALLNRWIWGYEPIIHLWHKSQPLKVKVDNPNIERIRDLNTQSIHERIERLKKKYNERH
jgi:hypothetical protein